MREVQPMADDWGLLATESLPLLTHELREVARLSGLRAIHRQLFDGLHLSSARCVLEVGCGPWVWESLLRAQAPKDTLLVGIDPYLGFAHAAERPNVFVSDGHALPFDQRIFDAVYCSRVLTHIGPAEALIDEMVRVCRRGGMVGAFEWTFSHWEIEDDGGLVSDAVHHAIIDNHLRPDAGVELPDLLRAADLTGVMAVPYRERITDPYDSPLTLQLIERYTQLVIAQGLAPAADVAAWYSGILDRIDDGRFAFTRTGIAAWGKV